MVISNSNEHSTIHRNPSTFFGFAATAWNQFGDYLQRRHQARKNKKTLQLLLEYDDYLLRDIGISRKLVQQIKQSSPNSDARLELQKLRITNGRDLLH